MDPIPIKISEKIKPKNIDNNANILKFKKSNKEISSKIFL